jgi:hypothetical protein
VSEWDGRERRDADQKSHQATAVTLERIETKLDALIDVKKDHETRIRSVERKQWTFAGVASVVGVIGGALLKTFGIGHS